MFKKIRCGVEESFQKTMAIVMTEKMLHIFWQNPNMENDNYKSQFNAYVAVLEAYLDGITVPPALVDSKIINLYPSLSN